MLPPDVRLIVSSADRNLSIYPTPASYVVTFDEPFANVVSMTLVSASIPLVAHQVSTSNNVFRYRFAENHPATEVEIPIGDYASGEDLATTLTGLLNSIIRVNYVARRDGFAFNAASPFELLFDGGDAQTNVVSYAKGSCARILGFGPRNYVSSPAGALSSAFKRDLSHTSTAVIYVDDADVNVSINDSFNRSFAVISRQDDLTVHMHDMHDMHMKKTFDPPMGKMGRIRVRINDVFGCPYDFQNRDHRLEFVLGVAPPR